MKHFFSKENKMVFKQRGLFPEIMQERATAKTSLNILEFPAFILVFLLSRLFRLESKILYIYGHFYIL